MDCAVLINIKNASKNRSGHGLTGQTECHSPVLSQRPLLSRTQADTNIKHLYTEFMSIRVILIDNIA